ncbi:MAG TPA: hypothetical protein VNN79_07415 [Actinomycetota bacterium]|nr:hypothetical protein [Actinomycetota bacterium]
MPDIAAAAADLVERLRAGGLRACMDLADLNPPGLIVRAPEVSFRFKAGDWDAAWTVHAVSPDPGFDGAMKILGPLIDDAQAAVGYSAVTARPVTFQTIDGADLPAYELTWTDRIT